MAGWPRGDPGLGCGRRPAPGAHRAAPARPPAAPPPRALPSLSSSSRGDRNNSGAEGEVTPGTFAGMSPGAAMTPSPRGATERRSLRSDVPAAAAALSVPKWPPPAAACARPAAAAAPIRAAPVANQKLPRVQKPLAPLETAAPAPASPRPSRAAPPGWGGRSASAAARRVGAAASGPERARLPRPRPPPDSSGNWITSVTGSHPAGRAARNQHTDACGSRRNRRGERGGRRAVPRAGARRSPLRRGAGFVRGSRGAGAAGRASPFPKLPPLPPPPRPPPRCWDR